MKSPYDYDQTDDLLSRMHVPICSSFVRGNMPTWTVGLSFQLLVCHTHALDRLNPTQIYTVPNNKPVKISHDVVLLLSTYVRFDGIIVAAIRKIMYK